MKKNCSSFIANTYSFTITHTAIDCINILSEKGFEEFELMMYPGHIWPTDFNKSDRNKFLKFLAANNFLVSTLNMPNIDINISAATKEMRSHSLKHMRKVIELASDIGVPAVVLGPGKANPLLPAPKDELLGYFYSALDELEPLARKLGTSILIENMPFSFLPDIKSILTALDNYGNKGIGIVYDVANGHFIKENINEALHLCNHLLKVVHLSDTTQRIYKHDAVGLGDIDFSSILIAIKEIEFIDKLVLEIITPDPISVIESSVNKLKNIGW
jgi:hypothetical protein